MEAHLVPGQDLPIPVLVNRSGFGYRSYDPNSEVWDLGLRYPGFMRFMSGILFHAFPILGIEDSLSQGSDEV